MYKRQTYTQTGAVDDRHSGLRGKLTLTKYLADEELEKYAARYPELTIKQPPYTMIEFDDSVADDANISNLDNKTGYKYGNTSVSYTHLQIYIFSRIFRWRCVGAFREYSGEWWCGTS